MTDTNAFSERDQVSVLLTLLVQAERLIEALDRELKECSEASP